MAELEGSAAAVDLFGAYCAELRGHAIALVWLGYRRLSFPSASVAEEDAITGELVKAMRAVTEDPEAPEWTEHYSVNEQQRANIPEKLGKHRPIIDIEFERHTRGPRPRLKFEAKRLLVDKDARKYLGKEGLGAFLDGYYPTTHGEAGMLGYVQAEDPKVWALKLSQALKRDATKYRVVADGQWADVSGTAFDMPSYSTQHKDAKEIPVLVIHLLLGFAATPAA